MLGSRSIWHDGWKAVTTHPTHQRLGRTSTRTRGSSTTSTSTAPSCTTSPPRSPSACSELINLWYAEAGANGAFPLDDRSRAGDPHHAAAAALAAAQPLRLLPRPRRRARVPGGQHPQPLLRHRRAGRHPRARRRRACCSRTARASAATPSTSRTTGCTTSTASSAASSRRSSPTEELPTGEDLILSAAFEKDGEDPPGVAVGTLSLFHGDVKVGEGRIKTQPGKFSLAGDGLCVGRDSSDPVTDDYPGTRALGVHRRHDQPRRHRRQRRALRRPRTRSRRHDGPRIGRPARWPPPTTRPLVRGRADELARRPGQAGDRRVRRPGLRRGRVRAGAGRGSPGRVRQRRHAVVREADADPARLHPAPARRDGRGRRGAARAPALEGRLRARLRAGWARSWPSTTRATRPT